MVYSQVRLLIQGTLIFQIIEILIKWYKRIIIDRKLWAGIANRYGLSGQGIKYQWQRAFPHPSRPAVGSTQLPVTWVPFLFPGVHRRGLSVDHPPLSSSEVKEK